MVNNEDRDVWLFVDKARRRKREVKGEMNRGQCGVKWRHKWISCHWANE
jgi:hypothetical protein